MCRRSFAAVLIGIGVCASALEPALAQEALRVARTAGAESCPDEAELGRRVSLIRGPSAAAGGAYDVRFSHADGRFSAELRTRDDLSVRTLESSAADCEALARATAVTLALLFDAAEPQAPPEPALVEPPPPAAVPAAPAASSRAAELRPETSEPLRLGLGLGAGLTRSVVRPWSDVFLAELGLRAARLRFGAGAEWIPGQRLAFGPGSVELGLIAANVRACWAAYRRSWLQVETCAGVSVGSLSARPRGFRDAESRARTFAAVPLELAVGQASDHVSWELGAGVLFVFRRNQFEIEGLGTVYDAPSIAGMLSLRAAGWIEL
jgi:hypothetical protein